MNEDRLNELLERCESGIERELLRKLCPDLKTDYAQELDVQHKIDYYGNMSVTIPDFAFPDMQIAIYCDSYKYHKGQQRFLEDRLQSRELQLRDWVVLRFTDDEINAQVGEVIEAILRAIEFKVVGQFNNIAEKFYRYGLSDLDTSLSGSGGDVSNARAIENFTKAIALNSCRASAFRFRATVYCLIGDYARAIADYTQAIKLNPRSPSLYFECGTACDKTGDRKLAEDNYAVAQRLGDLAGTEPPFQDVKDAIKHAISKGGVTDERPKRPSRHIDNDDDIPF